MMHQSVKTEVLIFFWLEKWALICLVGYVSSHEPVAHILATVTGSLMRVEIAQLTLICGFCFVAFGAGRTTHPLYPWLAWIAKRYSTTRLDRVDFSP